MARMTNLKVMADPGFKSEQWGALLNAMLEKSAADELLSENWTLSRLVSYSRLNSHFVMHSDTSLAYAAVPDIYGKFDIVELMKCEVCEDYELDSEVTEDEVSGKQCCNSCRSDLEESRRELEDAQWKQDSERNA